MLLAVSIIEVVTFLLLLGTFNSLALSLNRKWLHPMLWSLVLGGLVVMQHLCFWDQVLVGFSLWTSTRYILCWLFPSPFCSWFVLLFNVCSLIGFYTSIDYNMSHSFMGLHSSPHMRLSFSLFYTTLYVFERISLSFLFYGNFNVKEGN